MKDKTAFLLENGAHARYYSFILHFMLFEEIHKSFNFVTYCTLVEVNLPMYTLGQEFGNFKHIAFSLTFSEDTTTFEYGVIVYLWFELTLIAPSPVYLRWPLFIERTERKIVTRFVY